MSDGADRESVPRRALSAEITEEWDDALERLTATFHLRLDHGDDGVDDADESEEDEAFWDHAQEHWTDEDWAREEERQAAAERDDPHRGLTIDEAIALARTSSSKVTVWLDHEPWDASDPTTSKGRVWPPGDLDLRPRWSYESADSSRASAWWVRFFLDAEGLTPAMARACVESLPNVVTVRSSVDVPESARQRRGGSVESMKRRGGHVDVECLVDTSDGSSAIDTSLLMSAVSDATRGDVSPPRSIRLRLLRDWLLRRRHTSYTSFANGVGVSPSVLGPATDEELRDHGPKAT